MHEVKPEAKLASDTDFSGTIDRIYQGYRRCYSDEEGGVSSLPVDKMEAFIRKMLKAEHPHESPLEHASLTWHITCSRACSHQLVRHRIASYSQQSQRYVKMNDIPVIVPPSLSDKIWGIESFVGHTEAYYNDLVDSGIPAEDARYLLPNATATQLVVTMNFRSLLHFFSERCCNRAQWEIRSIASQMLEQCKQLYPCVFEHAGPHCKRIGHCPEAKPCGKQPWKE